MNLVEKLKFEIQSLLYTVRNMKHSVKVVRYSASELSEDVVKYYEDDVDVGVKAIHRKITTLKGTFEGIPYFENIINDLMNLEDGYEHVKKHLEELREEGNAEELEARYFKKFNLAADTMVTILEEMIQKSSK